MAMARARLSRLPLLCWYAVAAICSGPRAVAGELIPGVLERVVLAPTNPYHIKVGIGQAKFLGFSCMGGPADIVISLSTYAERADPLLFLSLNPNEPPSIQQHDASSFGQWREDASGDHYVIAKAVNPKGGILGLVNMRHFAGEELDGILSIHCTFIVAFDTLFWDHLRSSAVCPVGTHIRKDGTLVQAGNFCSGNGQCGKQGDCECDGDYAGPACEHSNTDVVVAADGHYRFKVATGRYQYFRVRIPPRFPGGYLEVKVMAEQPLVVLVRGDDLPTKGNFELSNFDDWVGKKYISVLKYKVASAESVMGIPPYGGPPPPLGALGAPPPPLPPLPGAPPVGLPGVTGVAPPGVQAGRRLVESFRDNVSVESWADFFDRAQDIHDGFDVLPSSPARRLAEETGNPWTANCPDVAPAADNPACKTQGFRDCESSCNRCMGCVKGGHDGQGDRGCTDACDACISPTCINTLAQCASHVSCLGADAMRCEAGCGSCMACFDSNDPKCAGCRCCLGCLPLAAKCSMTQHKPAEYNRFAFVGVYNHRRYYNDRDVVHAAADISLTADPEFARTELPADWLAELYDKFHDIRSLGITQREIYSDGAEYIYELQVQEVPKTIEVKMYRDRLTLLHIGNTGMASDVILNFAGGPKITHILSSSKAAPKTFFDFDQRHERDEKLGGQVRIQVRGVPVIWCALFGAEDGYTQMSLSQIEVPPQSPAVGFALVCVFGLLCALLVLGVIYGGAQKLGEFLGMDPSIPLMERLGCLVRNVNPHESTASLTRTGSLTGYIGSDVIDRSVEDQYLHRGGAGDDGI